MKETIKHAVIYAALGIILAVAICAIIALVQALPSILNWVAGYIGEFMTWVVFLFIGITVILYCIAE